MFRLFVGLLLLATISSVALLARGPQDDARYQPDTSKYMEKKLDSARNIVAGLATEDFKSIGKAAQELTLISQESDWNVVTTDNYLRLSSNFRSSTNRLRDAANEQDIEKSTLAYIEVTLNCVRCHQYLRGDRK